MSFFQFTCGSYDEGREGRRVKGVRYSSIANCFGEKEHGEDLR
jgi:hypothetical protein